jgi:hypothetical protein
MTIQFTLAFALIALTTGQTSMSRHEINLKTFVLFAYRRVRGANVACAGQGACEFIKLFHFIIPIRLRVLTTNVMIPTQMVSDHFNATPTSMEKFWIRGSSAAIGAAIYAMSLLAANQAAQVAFYLAAAVAVLYPFNAKFNLFKDNLSIKYPMHYVPEVLMATLTLLGAYVLYL